MKLGELLAVLGKQEALPADAPDREISDIAHDSRKVKPGSLFVAVRGFHSDGHQFIPQALQQGAAAVIAEEDSGRTSADVPLIIVGDSRRALALLADAFYGHPSRKLSLIGITGTNGKTTTSYLVRSVIEAGERTAGLIGTIDYRVGSAVYQAPNTTPESLELQRLLSEMVAAGADSCVMEVSSHALALDRTLGCTFAVAAFTNLSQDHLDFHRTMDDYFEAKLRLFAGLPSTAHAIVNADDAHAEKIIRKTHAKVITTGFAGRADVRPTGAINHGIGGLSFEIATPRGAVHVESPLVGRHNVFNILTAAGIGTAMGFSPEVLGRGIRNMKAVPGRMEKVDAGQPFGVIVDYAHTEDAITRLLEAIREVAAERIITVFGCGGDRDRTKRPKMGASAVSGSDIVIVTSDNPRTEDPLDIIREIEAGMAGSGVRIATDAKPPAVPGRTPYLVIPDRREAVAAAIRMAQPGDVVVLAGKGHEDYQIIGERKLPFDDREVAREEIRNRMMNASETITLTELLERLEHMEIKGISIDSRNVKAGELFVAIKGDRFDGHDFVPDAIKKGAWGALVERFELERRSSSLGALKNIFSVKDTLVSLQEMSGLHRKKFSIPVVGITGSNGKTTTKEMLASILKQKGPVLKNEGNLNNHIGVPLTLLKLEAHHTAAAIEMGMSALGEIDLLARLAGPGVGVITNIGPAHLEFLGSMDTVAEAKGELLGHLGLRGTAVLNADDRYFGTLKKKHRGRVLSFGIDAASDVRAVSIQQERDVTLCSIAVNGSTAQVRLRAVGKHNVYNALAAAAAGIAVGMSLDAVKRGLDDFTPGAMRSEIRHIGGRTVLVDCYNANPVSMEAALVTLAALAAGGRTVAVLGDMLELGGSAVEAHRAIGAAAARLGVNLLITIGALAKHIAAGAIASGMPDDRVREAQSHAEAAALLKELTRPGDIVLLKGSRGMRMEKILEEF